MDQQQEFWDKTKDEYAQVEGAQLTVPEGMRDEPLSWTASEYVHHEKGFLWFMLAIVVAGILLACAIFLLRSWSFAILTVAGAASVIALARRPPRTVSYQLSAQGIAIDDKRFSFHDFRSFGVVQEGAMYSVRLTPNKRLMPLVSVYFPTEYGERIVEAFGTFLPMQHIERGLTEAIAEKLRF